MIYEIHGDAIPHLHVHLYPRQVGDPFEGGPIDPCKPPRSPYDPGELEVIADRIRSALA